MPIDIQATGFLGIAFETAEGTYVAPTKYFPIRSESLKFNQDTQWRRLIRGIADELGAVAGNSFVDGDIEMELLEDVLPYFLYASRATVAKTGAGPDYTYTTTPQHGAQTVASGVGKPTLSITVVRDGVAFGYTGCRVASQRYSVDSGLATMAFSIVGRDEATVSVPTPTFTTTVPFGMGSYTISIPTASAVFDVDTYELAVNDNAEPLHRLWTARSARLVKYGEREVTLSLERDFQDRTEFDAFKALTAQTVTILVSKGAVNQVSFLVPNGIKSDYEINGLGSQGDLVRTSFSIRGEYNTATSKSVEIICKTQESIV